MPQHPCLQSATGGASSQEKLCSHLARSPPRNACSRREGDTPSERQPDSQTPENGVHHETQSYRVYSCRRLCACAFRHCSARTTRSAHAAARECRRQRIGASPRWRRRWRWTRVQRWTQLQQASAAATVSAVATTLAVATASMVMHVAASASLAAPTTTTMRMTNRAVYGAVVTSAGSAPDATWLRSQRAQPLHNGLGHFAAAPPQDTRKDSARQSQGHGLEATVCCCRFSKT